MAEHTMTMEILGELVICWHMLAPEDPMITGGEECNSDFLLPSSSSTLHLSADTTLMRSLRRETSLLCLFFFIYKTYLCREVSRLTALLCRRR